MVGSYGIYGLRVRSDLELDAEPCAGSDFDVVIELDATGVSADRPPPGTVLAEHTDATRGFWIVRTPEGYELGIRGVLEARIAADFRSIRVAPARLAARDLLVTFAQGAVLGTLLTLSGACVVHASAIEIEGKALAFVGNSGCGKSMLAALCCAAGGRLVTDDLLVVRAAPGATECQLGTTRLRLRQTSSDVAKLLDSEARLTADDRWAVATAVAQPRVPLHAILLPERATGDRAELVRMSAARAAVALTSCPRIPGFRDEGVLAAGFRHAASLARAVPIYTVRVPEQNRSPEAIRELVQRA